MIFSMRMSVATRITLLIVLLLSLCSALAGVAFLRVARQSLDAPIQGRLDARLSWLAAALDIDLEDGEIQLEPGAEPIDAAEHWQIATHDGRVLWSSGANDFTASITRQQVLSHGSAEWTPVAGEEITLDEGPAPSDDGPSSRWRTIPLSELPQPIRDAATVAVPGFEINQARIRTRGGKQEAARRTNYELHGQAAGRGYEIQLDGTAKMLRIRDRAESRFLDYEMPVQRRLELALLAGEPAATAMAEYERIRRILWTLGPLTVIATGVLLILLIRWQLQPLKRITDEASRISPAIADGRIGPVGPGLEFVRLRDSINAMLARLAEALSRERHFASSAAHELRTPLAQMRLTLDVALRKDRDAAEYREALLDLADDAQRLEKLVAGLLHLARGSDDLARTARLARLADVLNEIPPEAAGQLTISSLDGLWIHGDVDLLRAAIRNVLDNAARHAPGQPIDVHLDRNSAVIELAIADRGPGVPSEHRERIFQPLTRLDHSSAPSSGFGLGLAIARSTLRAFGGDLICRSRRDGLGGAEFVFTFRRAPAPAKD